MEIFDKIIIQELAKGRTQYEISETLKKKNIKPNSTSLIEKRLKAIRAEYKAYTNFHLAVILCRKKIIK